MITKKDIVEINKEFDEGVIVNESSLDFALSANKNTKDWIKQLAYLVRAILIDHVFEEGNKRTSAALIMVFIEENKLIYDPQKVDQIVIEILKKNINNINKIRRMIKNAIK
ncbi:Fic family protein [Candidatus Woesearchaeota archaeon]|nr:Fic family protein [Candidatus Woesearchaeota archaeon]